MCQVFLPRADPLVGAQAARHLKDEPDYNRAGKNAGRFSCPTLTSHTKQESFVYGRRVEKRFKANRGGKPEALAPFFFPILQI